MFTHFLFKVSLSSTVKESSTSNLISVDLFGAAYEDKKPFPLSPLFKLCYTYPTMMKIETAVPYMKRSEKYKNQVKHPLISADISIFPSEISRFCYILK